MVIFVSGKLLADINVHTTTTMTTEMAPKRFNLYLCTAHIWSIDSSQSKVSTDQYHMTLSQTQVETHQGQVFSWSWTLTSLWIFVGSLAQVFSQMIRTSQKTRSPLNLYSYYLNLNHFWNRQFLSAPSLKERVKELETERTFIKIMHQSIPPMPIDPPPHGH